jgi:purine-binding chemotaxis protein CheW
MNNSCFAIDVLLVREINRNFEITEVDPAPDFVMGLMNLRGQIVAVTDLGIRLGIPKRELTRTSCCIVLKTNHELGRMIDEGLIAEKTSNDMVGLIVDKIGDMIAVDESRINPPPANMGEVDEKYLSGVVTLETELVTLLNISKILTM